MPGLGTEPPSPGTLRMPTSPTFVGEVYVGKGENHCQFTAYPYANRAFTRHDVVGIVVIRAKVTDGCQVRPPDCPGMAPPCHPCYPAQALKRPCDAQ
jgi:hypothetical protein